jgi:hypothetical protein
LLLCSTFLLQFFPKGGKLPNLNQSVFHRLSLTKRNYSLKLLLILDPQFIVINYEANEDDRTIGSRCSNIAGQAHSDL